MPATYCLETVFQAAMYFSMQELKHDSSPREREVEGFGTQRSKQCSFTFSINCLAFIIAASCLTWFINWVFGSEEEERASIFAVFDAREDKGFVLFFVQ